MITSWQLYWITRLDGIHTALFNLCLVSTLVLALGTMLYVIYGSDEDVIKTGKLVRRWIAIPIILGLAAMLTPSTKEMAAILVIPRIVSNEDVQSEASDLYNLAKDWMKKQVGETAKEVEKQ